MPSKFNLAAALILPALLLLTVSLYWQGLDGPFLLDDRQNIVRQYISVFDWDAIVYAVTHNTSGIFGRPVSVLSFVVSGLLHGPASWGYKYHNLLIHLVNGLLITWLFIRILPLLAPSLDKKKAVVVAGVLAGAWLVHPLMVSTVLYAVQRMAQLSALFTLLALLAYVLARQQGEGKLPRFYVLAYLVFPLALILALLSKENGALIPLYVLAIEMLVFRFSFASASEKRRVLGFLAVFVAVPVLVGTYYLLTHFGELANYSGRNFTMAGRLLTQLHVLAFYLKLILLPRLADMTLFHDVEAVTGVDWLTAALMVFWLAAAFLLFYLRKRAPVAAFGIAWFLISHLMESTFISLELVFEHRNYLASLGAMLPAFYYLLRSEKTAALRFVPGAYLLLLVFLTHSRVQEWSSVEVFHTMAVTEHPGSYRAQIEYANLRYGMGFPEDAVDHLEIARQLNPKDFGALVHSGLYLCGRGREGDIKDLLEQAAERARQYPVSAYSLSSIDTMLGLYSKEKCPGVTLDDLLSLVRAASGQEDNRNNPAYLGYLNRIEGQIHLLSGEYRAGVEYMVAAYQHTLMASILAELVEIQLRLKRIADAEEVLSELEKINAESFGIETHKIKYLKERLAETKLALEAVKGGGESK